VESSQIKGVSQRAESDVSPRYPDNSVFIRVSSAVTQHEHHVLDEDTEEVVENKEPEGQVHDSIVAHKPKKTIRKLTLFSYMVVTYALSVEVVEDSVLTTYREAELSSESEMWKNAMLEEIESLYKNNTRELAKLPKGKKAIGCK